MNRPKLRDHLVDLSAILVSLRALTAPLVIPLAGMLALAANIAAEPRILVEFYRNNKAIAVCLGLVVLFSLINATEYHYRTIYYGLLGVSSVLIGYQIAKSGRALYLATILYVSFVLILIVCAAMFGWSPDDISDYFPPVSRNGIAFIATVLQIFYSAAYFRAKGKAPLFTPILTLAICVACYGRSGTGFAFILLAVSCAQAIIGARSLAKPTASLAAGIALMAYALIGPQIAETIADSPEFAQINPMDGSEMLSGPVTEPALNSNWSYAGFQSIRWAMASEYLSALGPKSILLGGDMSKSPLIEAYNMNPHNSFIRGHAYFGIAYLALTIAVAFSILTQMRPENLFLIAMLAIYAGRAFFDAFALFDTLDFVFFFSLFSLGPIERAEPAYAMKTAADWNRNG